MVMDATGTMTWTPDPAHDSLVTSMVYLGLRPTLHLASSGANDTALSITVGAGSYTGQSGTTGGGDTVVGGIVVALGSGVTRASLGLATTDSPEFAGLNIGAATDTTITRVSAGKIAVEGDTLMRESANSATQAQQVAASSTTQFVSPAHQQDHQSAAKGYVYVFYPSGVPTTSVSYNVLSLTDNGVGDTTVRWSTDFSSALLFATIASVLNNSDGAVYVVELLVSRTLNTSRYQVYNTGFATVDGRFCAVALGFQ